MDGVVFTLAAVLRAPPDRRRAWAVGVAVVSLIEAAGLHGVMRSLTAHRLISSKVRSLEAAVSRAWMRGSGAELVQSVPLSAPEGGEYALIRGLAFVASTAHAPPFARYAMLVTLPTALPSQGFPNVRAAIASALRAFAGVERLPRSVGEMKAQWQSLNDARYRIDLADLLCNRADRIALSLDVEPERIFAGVWNHVSGDRIVRCSRNELRKRAAKVPTTSSLYEHICRALLRSDGKVMISDAEDGRVIARIKLPAAKKPPRTMESAVGGEDACFGQSPFAEVRNVRMLVEKIYTLSTTGRYSLKN